jgi:hypothetical protein
METNTLDKMKAALGKLKTSKVKWDDTEEKQETKEPVDNSLSGLGAMGSTAYTIGSSSSYSYGNITINSSGNTGIGTALPNSYYYATGTGVGSLTHAGLHVTADAKFDGDIKWKGRSLGKLLEGIEDRLALLADPDPKKLEKFAALKKAYDHYKLMEKLIGDDTDVNS